MLMGHLPSSETGPVAVLGAGSWGMALAILIARNNHEVTLWGHDSAHINQLARERANHQFLPGHSFPETLTVTDEIHHLGDLSQFLIVVPSHAFRSLCERIEGLPSTKAEKVVAWGTKGFEPGSGKLLGEVAVESFGGGTRLAAISGPSFAAEVAAGLPTALTVAAKSDAVGGQVANWLHSDRMRVYTNPDLTGVQLGGAIKNVMAIATGISDGLGFGANARAALVTRGLAELKRLGEALGGRSETFMGLTGMGDLILTCTDDQSRNRRLGLGLGQGASLESTLSHLGQEVEGVNTAQELKRLNASLMLSIPIIDQVYEVLFNGRPPIEAVDALLSRELRSE